MLFKAVFFFCREGWDKFVVGRPEKEMSSNPKVIWVKRIRINVVF